MDTEQFNQLIAALQQQTDAINRLADSNAALIMAMADAEGLDSEETKPEQYLDTPPCL
ncbi:hypothetical protein [Marinobacter sp.]|uniref:hypothetical protein n=1 Tax=Marinobacter sp. TaxID=50741 RepID=UPI003561F130